MIEVTAAAFRFAICLDRIFILLPTKKQAVTYTKWRHNGCKANMLTCYFRDITGCHVSSKEIDYAINNLASDTGKGFDAYPLNKQKVLFLRGLPRAGLCDLCYDTWPTSSSFFDGVQMEINGMADTKNMLHFTAFASQIKLPYISQFLRFLLRPRKWFDEALSQIVQFRMHSPLPTLSGSDQSCQAGQSACAVEKASFPKSFISLHIR